MWELWTDGSCKKNPGPGSWGCIVLLKEKQQAVFLHGSDPETTNNRMELMAILRGLQFVPDRSRVLVHSDSKYALRTCFGNWKPTTNLDLIKAVRRERGRMLMVKEIKVKGHSGDFWNELADRLAGSGYWAVPPVLEGWDIKIITYREDGKEVEALQGRWHQVLSPGQVARLG